MTEEIKKETPQKKFELSIEEREKLIKLLKSLEIGCKYSEIYIIGRLLKFAGVTL